MYLSDHTFSISDDEMLIVIELGLFLYRRRTLVEEVFWWSYRFVKVFSLALSKRGCGCSSIRFAFFLVSEVSPNLPPALHSLHNLHPLPFRCLLAPPLTILTSDDSVIFLGLATVRRACLCFSIMNAYFFNCRMITHLKLE